MFQRISQRNNAFDAFVDIRQEISQLIPEPDPQIVKALIADYGGFDWSIRLPFQSAPAPASYDLEEVRFFARILTMLAKMGIYPPAQVQTQGGGKLPSIGGSFDGPTQITPTGSASGRYLNVPQSEDDIKRNALSSQPGGLADAARGQVPAVATSGRPQVSAAMRAFQDRFDDIDAAYENIPDAQVTVTRPAVTAVDSERKRNDSILIEMSNLVDTYGEAYDSDVFFEPGDIPEEFRDMPGSVFSTPREIPDQYANMPVSQIAVQRQFEVVRNINRLNVGIRRRLNRLRRVTPETRERVIELLPPLETPSSSEMDDSEFDGNDGQQDQKELQDQWAARHPRAVLWFRNLGARRYVRYEFIRKVAGYLLIPVLLSPALLLHKNVNQEVEDDLVRLFRALPTTHWFRDLSIDTWAFLVTVTPRADNYILLQRVYTGVANFDEDTGVLWVITKLLHDGDQAKALAWFELIKSDVAYRYPNRRELAQIMAPTNLLRGFEWCYVLKANPSQLNLVLNFTTANPPITPTTELVLAIKKAQQTIDTEYTQPNRTNTFDELFAAFAQLLVMQNESFSNAWISAMMQLYDLSNFWAAFGRDSFGIVLNTMATRSQSFSQDAPLVLEAFLKRFHRDGEEMAEFGPLSDAIRYEEDPIVLVHQFLFKCKNYFNDQHLDALAYSFLNSDGQNLTFAQAAGSVEGDDTLKKAIYVLMGAANAGVFDFVNRLRGELASVSELPNYLRSVGLARSGVTQDTSMVPQRASQNRQLLSVTDLILETRADLYRVGNQAMFEFQQGLGFALRDAQNVINIVTVSRPRGAVMQLPEKPSDQNASLAVQLYRKPAVKTDAGAYLFGDEWVSYSFTFVATASICWLVDDPNGFFAALPLVLSSLRSAAVSSLTAFQSASPWTQSAVVGSSLVVYTYGPKKVAQTITEIIPDVAAGTVSAVKNLPIVLACVGGLLLLSSVANKRQKT